MPRMIGLIHTATVYGEGASGAFDDVLTTGLRCRLANRRTQPGATGLERAELGHNRAFIWGPDYELPTEHVQIAVNGFPDRWNVEAGTVSAFPWEDGSFVYRRASVVRAL